MESVRISATISAEDNEVLEAIIERAGLKKSTIIGLTVKCTKCEKELSSYPFACATTCIKCTLDENFQEVNVKGAVTNQKVVLVIEGEKERSGVEID